MLLECKIRRKGGTWVDMPNGEDQPDTTYHFKPIDATREDSPHVAEVKNNAHLSRFIAAAPECYVIFEGKAPKVELAKPVALASEIIGQSEPPTAAETFVAEALATADTNGNGVLSVTELAEGIAANKFTHEQLRELLEAEEATGNPRKGFVKAITQALK